MNDENTKELYNLAPELYADHTKPMTETCMCWGFECGDGWLDPLRRLTAVLHAINLFMYDYGIVVKADQVKEKYGTLHFYYSIILDPEYKGGRSEEDRSCFIDFLDPIISNQIRLAEKECYDHCEICGAYIRDAEKSDWEYDMLDHQRVQTPGWITYICRKCASTPNEEGYPNYKNIDCLLTGKYGDKIRHRLRNRIKNWIFNIQFYFKYKSKLGIKIRQFMTYRFKKEG